MYSYFSCFVIEHFWEKLVPFFLPFLFGAIFFKCRAIFTGVEAFPEVGRGSDERVDLRRKDLKRLDWGHLGGSGRNLGNPCKKFRHTLSAQPPSWFHVNEIWAVYRCIHVFLVSTYIFPCSPAPRAGKMTYDKKFLSDDRSVYSVTKDKM